MCGEVVGAWRVEACIFLRRCPPHPSLSPTRGSYGWRGWIRLAQSRDCHYGFCYDGNLRRISGLHAILTCAGVSAPRREVVRLALLGCFGKEAKIAGFVW